MNITFRLTAATSGTTQSGNYNISGTTDGGGLNGVFIASGITRAQLITGHTVNNISDSVTGGTITSTGSASGGFCTNQITWYVTPPPSPCECFTIQNEGDTGGIFTYPKCSDGSTTQGLVPRFGTTSVCVQAGGGITITQGLLTEVSCGATCTVNDDCTDCI